MVILLLVVCLDFLITDTVCNSVTPLHVLLEKAKGRTSDASSSYFAHKFLVYYYSSVNWLHQNWGFSSLCKLPKTWKKVWSVILQNDFLWTDGRKTCVERIWFIFLTSQVLIMAFNRAHFNFQLSTNGCNSKHKFFKTKCLENFRI